jgi:hypothetical protein
MRVQDQTVKVSEARELESELQRLREENADLRKKLGESANIEAARKKAEVRVETLESKVRPSNYDGMWLMDCILGWAWADGRYDSGEGSPEGKRTERNI